MGGRDEEKSRERGREGGEREGEEREGRDKRGRGKGRDLIQSCTCNM